MRGVDLCIVVSRTFNAFFRNCSVCLSPFCIGFDVVFSLFVGNLSKRRTWENWAENCGSDNLRSHRRSIMILLILRLTPSYEKKRLLKEVGEFWSSMGLLQPWWTATATTNYPTHPSMLTESTPATHLKKILCMEERIKLMDCCSHNGSSSMSVDGNRKLVKKAVEKELSIERQRASTFRRDQDGLSLQSLSQTRFLDRFSLNRFSSFVRTLLL